MDRDLARDVAKEIDKRVSALRDELRRKQHATEAELTRTTKALGKASTSIADLERRLATTERRLADEARARHETEQAHVQELGTLQSEHAALRRDQAVQAGVPVAVLDARDDELSALADTARRGADLRARRLPDGRRAHLDTVAEAWSTWERTHLARRMRAVMLSRKLADAPIDDPGRPVDTEAFRAVMRELAELAERREATRAAAEDAVRHLTDDDALRGDSDADIAAGEDADRRIRATARDRVGRAVDRGDLMPPWFESALPGRPTGDDPRWWQVASSLVAYRILYEVDDPVSALGPEPAGDWPRTRHLARLGLHQAALQLRPAGTRPPAR